ncbi:MAG: sigma-70 family RNA polymerase sigma factor [Elusimicrobia bacterium]|nr:sigma-70 family RNA polymerase sigma factor [Candidatus Obscuribacterium magneticum]MCB4755847.1 sigma-70 family RNA polymerase sigma factor [Candidatus Obscuribacterium magneticum]
MTDDDKIVRAVLSGNRDSYATLVRRYQAQVLRSCLVLLANPVEAEDAAQDVFIKAYESLAGFHGESSFPTWLYRITHNHCMDLLRKKKRQKTDSLDNLVEDRHDTGEKLLDVNRTKPSSQDYQDLINEVMSTLSPDYKEILALREVGGFTYEEMASYLRCTLDAVKARLRRARQELREKARHFLGSKIVQ